MGRWRAVFALFNDLPLAVKLGLTTLGAMSLLGALAWIAVAALDTQRNLDARVAAAQTAERAGRRALTAVAELRLAAAEMRSAHDADAVEQAGGRAGGIGSQVQRLLAEMRETVSDPVTRDALGRASAALVDYQGKAAHEAELRKSALPVVESFLPLRGTAANAADALRDALARASLAPGQVAQAHTDLAAFLAAADAAHDAVLTFRPAPGTGADAMQALRADISGARVSLSAAQAEMQQRTAALAQLPDAALADASRALDAAGKALGNGAQQALDRLAAASIFALRQTEPANQALAGQVDGAISPFVDAAEHARDAAARSLERARRTLRLLSACALVVLLVLGSIFIHSITSPIRAMTRAMQAIAGGDAALRVGFQNRRDEVGRMAVALETLRGSVGRAFVQGEMIAQLPIGVVTVEPAAPFFITYVNSATRDLLSPLQASLPVAVDQLVGKSIDVLPERVGAVMADPARLPKHIAISLGGARLEITVSALRAADGSYSGTMLCWHDRSAQEQLSGRFERSVVDIARRFGEAARLMAGTADAMSRAANGNEAQLSEVATASRTASGHVRTVAGSAEQLAGSVRQVAQQVAESARIAGGAVAEAEATDRTVAGLADAAARIGDVVKLIRDIAERTNLLALNATIEAARAGESGRGFAVVAGEVKTLANQTAKATEEIAGQITGIQQETSQAVKALRSIGGTIRRMSEIATVIAGAVEEQGAATREIAGNVQEAAAGAAQVDSTIAAVGGSVQQTGAQAGEVAAAAQALTEQSATLAREVAEFLAALQAA